MTDLPRSSTLRVRRTITAIERAAPSQPDTSTHAPDGANETRADTGRALDSAALLQGRSHVSIIHNGEAYQLRATRLGKLILTK